MGGYSDGLSKYRNLVANLCYKDTLDAPTLQLSDIELQKLAELDQELSQRYPKLPRFVISFLERAAMMQHTQRINLVKTPAHQLIQQIDSTIDSHHPKTRLSRIVSEKYFQDKLNNEDPTSWPSQRIR